MYRYEEDGVDALGYFMLIGVVTLLCIALVVFAAWMGWVV